MAFEVRSVRRSNTGDMGSRTSRATRARRGTEFATIFTMGPWDLTWREQFLVDASCLNALLVLLAGSPRAKSDWTCYATSAHRLPLPPTTKQALESHARRFFNHFQDGASRWADFSEKRVVGTRGRGQIADLCRSLANNTAPGTDNEDADAILGPPSPRSNDPPRSG